MDAFGDSDTQDFAEQTQILSRWGDREALSSLQSIIHDCYRRIDSSSEDDGLLPVFLAGGCENWLDLVNFLYQHPQLRILGPSPLQMRKIRSPRLWAKSAAKSGLKFPKTILPPPIGDDGSDRKSLVNRWLSKPRSGSGGAAVRPVEGGGYRPEIISRSHYLQQEISGRVIGATCVIDWSCCRGPRSQSSIKLQPGQLIVDGRPSCRLIAVTESWSRHDLPGPKEFIYRGSWGPIQLQPEQRLSIERTAEYLGWRSGLCGWLQMDLIEDSDGQLWLLEVNPRWSSGMEVLLKSGLSNPVIPHAVSWGLSEAINGSLTKADNQLSRKRVGKSVLYAPEQIVLSEPLVAQLNALPRDQYADIPSPSTIGTVVPSGAPLLTVLSEIPFSHSETDSRGRLLQSLSERSRSVGRLLTGA